MVEATRAYRSGQRVEIHHLNELLNGQVGTIIGIASYGVVIMYIVKFDEHVAAFGELEWFGRIYAASIPHYNLKTVS